MFARALVMRSAISIHALREEGDKTKKHSMQLHLLFLSTPSVRRATPDKAYLRYCWMISIHALREEGDISLAKPTIPPPNFYPRPP